VTHAKAKRLRRSYVCPSLRSSAGLSTSSRPPLAPWCVFSPDSLALAFAASWLACGWRASFLPSCQQDLPFSRCPPHHIASKPVVASGSNGSSDQDEQPQRPLQTGIAALLAGAIMLAPLVEAPDALAARSSGRVGGSSFRSAPSRSYSAPSRSYSSPSRSYSAPSRSYSAPSASSRTNIYVAPPVFSPFGGYGYGIPFSPFGYGYGYSSPPVVIAGGGGGGAVVVEAQPGLRLDFGLLLTIVASSAAVVWVVQAFQRQADGEDTL